ncbi:MAG TPA: ATP-dependent helicase [Streptosporangiaceae bacterium]|nr:ATP-dependent helicase [Streptosporangiaceae bacterium]
MGAVPEPGPASRPLAGQPGEPVPGPVVGHDPESVLAALDPEQREVALATRGPVCVLAGAGTGKTRAVAHRIAYAALTGVVDPGHVLAVTFTTRAAGELRARLRQLGGAAGGLDRVQARTFHSAALRQLTHFWPQTVGGRPPTVLDSKVSLLSEAARRHRVTASPAELRDVASEIEWSKVTQVRPDEYAEAAVKSGRTPPLAADLMARLYASYEDLRRDRHLVDFESVLELTAAVLAEHQQAAAVVRDRYRYFVVDEYQDVNPLQKLLLDTWAGDRDDVCVVGDPRQTIYSFAGATAAYLTSFTADFPDATVVRLVRNYRSTPQVIALANQLTGAAGRRSLAEQLRGRPAAAASRAGATPALVAQRAAGPAAEFAEYADEQEEASAIASRVVALRAEGLAPRQVAVLVRTNAQTLELERAFAERGVPCQLRGAERFFDRPEVRQATGLLRAAAKSALPGPVAPAPRAVGAPPDDDRAGAAAEVRHILTGLGLTRDAPPGRGSARERWESLEALAQLAEDYFAANPSAALAGFTAELARRGSIEHAPAMHGVTLASLHAAKGLEWDVVFLPGLTDGNLPIVHAQTEEAIEEERRLLYVGVTRARQRIFLSWPLARSPGGRRSRKPSRFLDGLRPRRS